ncbi:MAG TPA: response regulator transcription factor [Terriglobales bacterium]|nr:response regulator transcription factor [Terriglobales bacterium]
MSRILIVEDEAHLAQGLRFNLEAEGYSVVITDTGEQALSWLLNQHDTFDALVLDVMLPGKDGFTVAKELRIARNYIPLLMLTARSRPEDVLRGFESGADDYLPKPFNLQILIARIDSLLRRKQWVAAQPPTEAKDTTAKQDDARDDTFTFDGKVIDFKRLQLVSGKKTYQLTLMETELFRYLIQNNGRPVTRKEILENVWNLKEDTDTRAIDNFIVRLRRYIEPEPAKPRYVTTVRGLGYQFNADPEA